MPIAIIIIVFVCDGGGNGAKSGLLTSMEEEENVDFVTAPFKLARLEEEEDETDEGELKNLGEEGVLLDRLMDKHKSRSCRMNLGWE